MIEHHAVKPRTPEWFALRANDITASEIGAVAGVGLYGSPYEVWAIKAGLASGPEENSAMTMGRWLEPAVPCALIDQRPDDFISIDYPLDLYVRDADIRLGGTPDARGVDRDGRPVAFEFKVLSRQSYERNWNGAAPMAYQLQLAANTMLLDADYGILAALVLGFQSVELVVERIDRHPTAEFWIRDIARRFWAAFDDGHAPSAPDYQRDADVIRQVFRPDPAKPVPIDLSSDNRVRELLESRAGKKEIIKACDDDVKAIDAELIHKLNGAEAAVLPGWKISHKTKHHDAQWRNAYESTPLLINRTKENAP
jgi:predicted phage-related endonuclease